MPNLDLVKCEIREDMESLIIPSSDLQNFASLKVGRDLKIACDVLPGEFFENKKSHSSTSFDGSYFHGEIVEITEDTCKIASITRQSKILSKPITLVMGIFRPQMLKRVLESLAVLPVRELILVLSDMSDKSFLLSHVLREEQVIEHIKYGVRQSGNPFFPKIRFMFDDVGINEYFLDNLPGLKVFGESEAEFSFKDLLNLSQDKASIFRENGINIIIGPERGWSNREKELFGQGGAFPFTLGSSTFRVDTAAIACAAQVSLVWELLKNGN